MATPDDEALAQGLAAVCRAGARGFIDLKMKLGTRWAEEILRKVSGCDFLIVLLSANSVHSEFVLEEVRLAREPRRHGASHNDPGAGQICGSARL
jgi:hypothetical protein